jgi:hypothetical protein
MVNELKVFVRLFNTDSKASDGSIIPRRVVDEYLGGEDYQLIKSAKLSVGGMTHQSRKLPPNFEGLIGKDDLLYVNDNCTHYISEIYFMDDDPFAHAILKIFDPDKFEGRRRENIVNLRGMLQSGCKLPVSVVIHALWSPSNLCEKIIRIKGCDFTANPAFAGAGTIKVMSDVGSDKENVCYGSPRLKDEERSFANLNGCVIETRYFTGEVIKFETNTISETTAFSEGEENVGNNEKRFSRSDIINSYGLNSIEAMATKNYSTVTESEFQVLVNKFMDNKGNIHTKITGPKLVLKHSDSNDLENSKDKNYWIGDVELPIRGNGRAERLDNIINFHRALVNSGNSQLLANISRDTKSKLLAILNSVPDDDPNFVNMMRLQFDQFFRNLPQYEDSDGGTPVAKELVSDSDISPIAARLSINNYPRIEAFHRILKSFQKYYESNKDNIEFEDIESLKDVIKDDIISLLDKVDDEIKSGNDYSSLFALGQYSSDELVNSGKRLAVLKRELMDSDDSEEKELEYRRELKNFLNHLYTYVFGLEFLKRFSVVGEGSLKLKGRRGSWNLIRN